jgi:hypothetical protein
MTSLANPVATLPTVDKEWQTIMNCALLFFQMLWDRFRRGCFQMAWHFMSETYYKACFFCTESYRIKIPKIFLKLSQFLLFFLHKPSIFSSLFLHKLSIFWHFNM